MMKSWEVVLFVVIAPLIALALFIVVPGISRKSTTPVFVSRPAKRVPSPVTLPDKKSIAAELFAAAADYGRAVGEAVACRVPASEWKPVRNAIYGQMRSKRYAREDSAKAIKAFDIEIARIAARIRSRRLVADCKIVAIRTAALKRRLAPEIAPIRSTITGSLKIQAVQYGEIIGRGNACGMSKARIQRIGKMFLREVRYSGLSREKKLYAIRIFTTAAKMWKNTQRRMGRDGCREIREKAAALDR